MFMENVDGDYYFLSLIALKQFGSVTVQFLSVDRSGYFQLYQIPFKKTGDFILPKPVAINMSVKVGKVSKTRKTDLQIKAFI